MEELIADKKGKRLENSKKKKNKRLKIIIIFTIIIIILLIGTVIVIDKLNHKEVKVKSNSVTSTFEDNKKDTEDEVVSNSDSLSNANTISNLTSRNNILIVNKQNKLDEEYMPYDLVIPNIKSDKEVKVRKEVAPKLEQLFADAKKDGINLVAISGFRTYDYQDYLYKNSVQTNGKNHATQYVAKAGYSEHQTGFALDLLCKEYMTLDEGFEKTNAFKWLEKNMSKYGFILRYLKDKEDITGYNYEPWHIRYVGVEIATEICSRGITLEEYLRLKG